MKIDYKCFECEKIFLLTDLIRLHPGCIPGPVTEDWMSGCTSLPNVFCKKCADIEIKEDKEMGSLPSNAPYRNNCPGSYFG